MATVRAQPELDVGLVEIEGYIRDGTRNKWLALAPRFVGLNLALGITESTYHTWFPLVSLYSGSTHRHDKLLSQVLLESKLESVVND